MNSSSFCFTFIGRHPEDQPDAWKSVGLTSTFLTVVVPASNPREAMWKARRVLMEAQRTSPIFPSGTYVTIFGMVEVHEVPEDGVILSTHAYGNKGYDMTGTMAFPLEIPASNVSFYGLRHPDGPDTPFWIAPDLG